MALYYDTMNTRKAQLDQVDVASFEWVWNETPFPDWLESNEAITWNSGKPGSGKSTLISSLMNEESCRLKKHLSCILSDPVLIHFFFDFRSGSATANTTLGMLRSFALQLTASSKTFESEFLKRCSLDLQGSWPDQESEMLRLICESVKSAGLNICGFVDGLDEFEGDLLSLVKTIKHLQQKAGKECFAMQDRNGETMQAYLEAAFSGLELYVSIETLTSLRTIICEDAQGVILWARFATDRVVQSVLDGDCAEDVLACLDDFPRDLQQVYERILRGLSSTEKIQAAIVFFVLKYYVSSFQPLEPQITVANLLMCYVSVWLSFNRRKPGLESDKDCPRFQLMILALVKGLVEFVHNEKPHMSQPRLIHKSLLSFLNTDEECIQLESDIRQSVDATIFGPMYEFQNMVVAAEIRELPGLKATCVRSDTFFDRLRRADSSDNTFYSKHAIRSVCLNSTSIEGLLSARPDLGKFFSLTTRTWIYRQWCLPSNGFEEPFQILGRDKYDRLVAQCPEVLASARWGLIAL